MKKGQFKAMRCALPGIEAVEASSCHAFGRHMHEQFGIGVIFQGAQKSASCRGMVEAGAGDTITVNAGEVHDGQPLCDAGRTWRMLYIDPAVVASAVLDITEGRTRDYEFCHPVIRDHAVAACFQRLYADLLPSAAEPPGLRQEESLLMLLEKVRQGGGGGAAAPVPAAIAVARSLIDDDPAASHALADLAAVSGLSRFQVVRGFARATGLTPHAYQVQRRIALARRMIAHGSALADAAAACGFADQSHMTRIFMRNFGISPKAYAAAQR